MACECECEPLMSGVMVSDSNRLHTISDAPGVRGTSVTAIPKNLNGLTDFIQSIILNNPPDLKEPFYVLDMGELVCLMETWSQNLPTVRPFYAVKCNPEPALLGAMAALGAGFDCASRAEIDSVLSLGVSPDRIIYANPCKAESHIKHAASVGVNLTTFDSKQEVEKIRKHHPKCGLLIRIKADDVGAKFPLGTKYGALPHEFESLLQAARDAQLVVSGVSFHIGSGATNLCTYRTAIALAKKVFDLAFHLGMKSMRVLNIGGGFMAGPQFEEAATAVKSAIHDYFPNELAGGLMTVIAEPGRFFATTPFTLAAAIIGKRVRGELREYWINDGVYGSLNNVVSDHAIVNPTPLASSCKSNNCGNPTTCLSGGGGGVRRTTTYCSTVFGPTCDAMDTVLTGQQLPELEVDDWLVFDNMGAYTIATGSNFNGFSTSAITTHLAYSSSSSLSQ